MDSLVQNLDFLFRHQTSVYGGSEIIGASFDFLPWFFGAGIAFILAHAAFKVFVPTVHH